MEFNTSPSFMNSSNKKSNYSYFNTEMGENLKEKMIKYSQNVRNKSKRNSSYKLPLKINNYFVDVNEADSKYYKLNHPKTHFKTNGNFYKRLKYSIPLNNLTQSRYDENNPNSNEKDDKRSKLIEKLIYNSQISFAQDLQRKQQEESESKEYKIMQDRIEVLKKSGIDVNNLFKEIEEKENKNENENEKENKKEDNNKNNIKNNSKKEIKIKFEHLISETDNENNTNINNQKKILTSQLKTPNSKEINNTQRKPTINSLEFYMKVKEYLRNKGKKENETNRNSINSPKNTFRSVSLPKKENPNFKNIINNENNYNTQPAFYSRNNIRGKDEVQKFIREKEKQRKKSEDKFKKDENNKNYHNYLNYSKLQKSIEKNNNKILLMKKNKNVKNKYYVGNNQKNKSINNPSKSAVVEQNDMFKIMIENKKLKNDSRKNSNEKNKMSKEKYDNFINMQEDRIKKGQLEYLFDDSPIKKNNNDNNEMNNSFQKEMLSAEKTVKKSNDLLKKNNLNKYLKNE
jgi:hypothetical protein